MPNFTLKQEDKLSIKLTHHMKKSEFRRIDLYFSLPKEMGINKNTLSETDYFNAGIKGRRAYYTKGLHLPLLHRRFASRMKRSQEEYKTNLNLFAYQYISALETDANEVLAIDDSEGLTDFYNAAFDLTDHCLDILKKHRSHQPKMQNYSLSMKMLIITYRGIPNKPLCAYSLKSRALLSFQKNV